MTGPVGPTGERQLSARPLQPWYREVSHEGWRALSVAGPAWIFEIYDSYALSLTMSALIVALSLTKSSAGMLVSSSLSGYVIGGIFFGWLADRVGRVRCLYLAVLIYSAFSGAVALSHTFAHVLLLRFLGGVGMGGAWAGGAALIAETWPAAHRAKGSALMQMGLPLGSMLAIAAVALVSRYMGPLQEGAWRWVFAIGALPAILLFPLIITAPESSVWLRRKESDGAGASKVSARAIFTRPLLIGFLFVFFHSYIYYAVFSWTPTFLVTFKHLSFVGSMGFTLIQQVGSLGGFLFFGGLADRVGRRPTFLLYLAIGLAGLIAFVFTADRNVLLLATGMSGFGVAGCFAGLGAFIAELLYESPSRALSMSLAYNGGRIGGLIAPPLVGHLAATEAGFQASALISCGCFLAAAVVMCIAPETKGRIIA
jgi:MFS family permease